MKTMHITNSWSETSGGVATFYRAILEAANRHRHPMSLIVPGPTDREEAWGEYARIYTVAAPEARLNPNYRTMYPDKYLWSEGRIRKILIREAPDLVEISDKYTLNYLGALLRLGLMGDISFRPVVVGLSFERMDVNFRSYLFAGGIGRAFSEWYMRHLYFPFFDHHIAISDQTAEELRNAGQGHEVARGIFRLPLGVDVRAFSPRYRSEFARRQLLRRIGAPDTAILLLYVGRMAPEKNLSLLSETMKYLALKDSRYHLILVGDGVSRDAFLKDAVKSMGSKVTWLGHLADREELARLYANCDFFVHPNPREPFGIAPLEAMASGLPLIAPDSGGIKEYANRINAGLCEAKGSAFAAAIHELVHDETRRRCLIEEALRTARAFRLDAVADQYLDLYPKIHSVFHQEIRLEEAMPDFISQPPSALRARVMRLAANTAASAYRLVADCGLRMLKMEAQSRKT